MLDMTVFSVNRFRKEWLVDVEKTLKEGNKVAAVLHGILERTKNPYVTEPSKEDIDLLKQLYSHGKYSFFARYIEYFYTFFY